MGMYTGLRFKGIISESFKDDISNIVNKEDFEWEQCNSKIFQEFGKLPRAWAFPKGSLAYMPWEDDDEEFALKFNLDTRELQFQCSLKNYDTTLESFLELIPKICDSVEHCEEHYEEWDNSICYELENNKLIETAESKLFNRYD